MLYAHANAEEQERIANAMKQTKDLHWHQRLHIISVSAQGKSVPELTELFAYCAATIRTYITCYNRDGLTGLTRQYSSGAPPKIPFSKAEWEEILHQSPAQFDRVKTAARNWSQSLLVEYFQAYHDITVTRQAVAASLKRHGLRLNRGRLKVTSPDPLYTVKRARVETLKKKPLREP